jgi:hypothetical protein
MDWCGGWKVQQRADVNMVMDFRIHKILQLIGHRRYFIFGTLTLKSTSEDQLSCALCDLDVILLIHSR